MRKFVVFTVMVLLIVVGVHAQDKINFMKVTDQLPNSGITTCEISGFVAYQPDVPSTELFNRTKLKYVAIAGDTCLWINTSGGSNVRVPIVKETIFDDYVKYLFKEAPQHQNNIEIVSYASYLSGIRIIMYRSKNLENVWTERGYWGQQVWASDMVVCIFNLTHEKSECNKQLITTVSSQNQNLTVKTVNNKMFIPQARYGDLLWSGVGNANFGKPRTYLR